MVIERKMYTKKGEEFDFNLKISLSSGIDEDGWRYVEIDISEFAANMCPEPSKITELEGYLHEH